MQRSKFLILVLVILTAGMVAAGCNPQDPCQFTTNYLVDLYRVPDLSAGVWGGAQAGQTHPISARTADGWVGFEPGIAQAPNVGLARLRYFQLNAIVTPSCLASVPLVTLADVQADIAASGGP